MQTQVFTFKHYFFRIAVRLSSKCLKAVTFLTRNNICHCMTYFYESAAQADRQGGPVSKVTTLPWPGWRKWSHCSRQSRAKESLRGWLVSLKQLVCAQRPQSTQRPENPPPFPLPHCNRAGISHWPVNSHSIKLLFNLTSDLHRNQDESGGMYLGKWPYWPYTEPAAIYHTTISPCVPHLSYFSI